MQYLSLVEQLRDQTMPRVKVLGEEFFEAGAVHELVSDSFSISATIAYSEFEFKPRVYVRDGQATHHECSCLSHRHGVICAHVWAMALESASKQSRARDRETKLSVYHETVEAGKGQAASVDGVPPRAVKTEMIAGKEPQQDSQQITLFDSSLSLVPTKHIPNLTRNRRYRSEKPLALPVLVIDLFWSRQCKLVVLRPYRMRPLEDCIYLEPEVIDTRLIKRFYSSEDSRLLESLLIETDAVLSDFQLPGVLETACAAASSQWEDYDTEVEALLLGPVNQDALMMRLCNYGNIAWTESASDSSSSITPLSNESWAKGEFEYRVEVDPTTDDWIMTPWIHRGGNLVQPLSEALMVFPGGSVLWKDGWSAGLGVEQGPWISMAKEMGRIKVTPESRLDAIRYWGATPLGSYISWPHVQGEIRADIKGKAVALIRPKGDSQDLWELFGGIRYDEIIVEFPREQLATIYDKDARVIQRDLRSDLTQLYELAECLGYDELPWDNVSNEIWSSLGLYGKTTGAFETISGKSLIARCQLLASAGYEVVLDGKRIRTGRSLNIEVESGIDWFDVHGEMDFSSDAGDSFAANLPELLVAVRKGKSFVQLTDGSLGFLSAEVLDRLKRLTDHVTYEEIEDEENPGSIRFRRSQAMLLDALLSAKSMNVVFDAEYKKLIKSLKKIKGVKAAKPVASFQGELREYQQAGLGWFKFLNDHRFGGCLADEMGLGKTVQVLSMLEGRRKLREKDSTIGPSLAVVPKSLLFNWEAEAKRFTPDLKVWVSAGFGRKDSFANWKDYDLILTTYATLARDVPDLTHIDFDYVILDEAQAIKNSHTQAAKACRLLNANHRLALTGTPIENHLGELWSLFEFLNPGMLGRSAQFEKLARNPDQESLSLISRAISPFVLRRTKSQVLTELPEKVQESIHCDLGTRQRTLYNELRDHYRKELTATVKEKGLEKSKIVVLEALLRLRQAACHPGLISAQHSKADSAKFDELMERLPEIVEGGHKAIIFSQFTSLLALLQPRLKKAGLQWAYLDGSTRNRQAEVERFQNDPNIPLFLISLKAGGHGLNLTAADYVFLLDPWWNPAVEAQAIDRAHRMGQQRTVFAYRMIAENTIEDKIALLQKSKQELAESVITENESLIRNLTFEDLQLLLE